MLASQHTQADIDRLRATIVAERTAAMGHLGITFAQVKADPAARQALRVELGRRGWLPTSPILTGEIPAVGSSLRAHLS